jgi:hypothetical protein
MATQASVINGLGQQLVPREEVTEEPPYRTLHVYFEVRSPYMCSSVLAARKLLLPFASIVMLVQ